MRHVRRKRQGTHPRKQRKEDFLQSGVGLAAAESDNAALVCCSSEPTMNRITFPFPGSRLLTESGPAVFSSSSRTCSRLASIPFFSPVSTRFAPDGSVFVMPSSGLFAGLALEATDDSSVSLGCWGGLKLRQVAGN
jgi:hypothetical protein